MLTIYTNKSALAKSAGKSRQSVYSGLEKGDFMEVKDQRGNHLGFINFEEFTIGMLKKKIGNKTTIVDND